MTRWTFKSDTGLRWHSGALLYAFAAYASGWWLLLASNVWALVPGTFLVAHGMIIAAYLVHECAHNTLFKKNQSNAQLGKVLGWVCGSCYGTFEDIRYKTFSDTTSITMMWFGSITRLSSNSTPGCIGQPFF